MSDGEFQTQGLPDEAEFVKRKQDKEEYDIKTLVKGTNVNFDSYRQGNFYYNIKVKSDIDSGRKGIVHMDGLSGKAWIEEEYQFPVPLDDIGTATLLSQDKAITFMRWIRKAIADKTFVKI